MKAKLINEAGPIAYPGGEFEADRDAKREGTKGKDLIYQNILDKINIRDSKRDKGVDYRSGTLDSLMDIQLFVLNLLDADELNLSEETKNILNDILNIIERED